MGIEGGLARFATTEADEWLRIEQLFLAHKDASVWGTARFAAELRSRDDQERVGRRGFVRRREAPTLESAMSGPVAWDVAEQVIGADQLDLSRPVRHSHVPRPPTADPERKEPRRRRRFVRVRQRGRAPAPTSQRAITEQEAAGMSSAARRLYGLADPPRTTYGW